MRKLSFFELSIVLVMLALLPGCAPKTRIIYQEVLIPVPVECPKPDNIREPIYPLQTLSLDAEPNQIAEAFVHSFKICRNEIKIRDVILEEYRKHKVGEDDE